MHDLPTEDNQSTGNITPSAGPVEREFTVQARTQFQLIFRRFLQHKLAVISVFVLVAIVLLAFVGGALWHYKYTDITPDNSVPPSGTHPFGTDNLGYDEFARVLRGTQRSLEIAFTVAILATVVGTIWGAIAGFYRGIVDSVMMRIVDLVLTIPIIAAGALLGHHFQSAGWSALALVIAGLSWPAVSRIVRGQTLSLREKEYVEAARALGAKDSRIIFRHILPNVIGQVIVVVTILVALAILTESALSYLGFGVQAPDTSLGTLISAAQTALQGGQWWLFYFPGIFIILICLSVNFIGDGLRDAFDPSQQRVRA
ncbi:ABC transporter permease [Actinospica sp.]|jgi:peptide/nickel transport system permease protein|uniref:ABC transporter permease n=1 Tax=Actinospica sp. TaxID=1872142 RepID=UPI002C70611F|nr:ABC transporter permease [Actinospica sp.]HWG24583.1 ABC transporter permease [Actinospica sp.]